MRTVLRHGLFYLSLLAASPALGQSAQRAELGPIVPRASEGEPVAALDRPLLLPPVTEAIPGETASPAKSEPETKTADPMSTLAKVSSSGNFAPLWGPASHYLAPVPPRGRFWFTPEFVYWQVQGQRVPPLVTSALPGVPMAGALGQPGTNVLFGGGHLNDAWRPGFRLRAGFWFDPAHTFGIEASGFLLDESSDGFTTASNGLPGLFRPFYGTNGQAQAVPIAFQSAAFNPFGLTPVLAGHIRIHASDQIWGEDVNFRKLLWYNSRGRVDFLLGYRHLGTDDHLDIAESLEATNPFPPPLAAAPGTRIVAVDAFRTTNAFDGGQLGLTGERWNGRWFLTWTSKVALGNTHRVATIDGLTTVLSPAAGFSSFAGGLLTQRSNIGRYSSDAFSVVPEISLNLGRQLTPRLRIFAGYTFLYWTNLWRAGEQIDTVLGQVPPLAVAPGAHPAFLGNGSNLWLQGASVGAEYRY